MVMVAAGLAQLALRFYHRSANDPDTVARWRLRLLGVSFFVSAAWGSAPWLLWDEVNNSNHVFIALMCLAIVARIVVNRANHVAFFLASFLPMATLLFVRFMVSFQPTDLILAVLVPLYGIQVFLDSNHISVRWDEEALMRFSYEDMSRELEEARDEALRKRTEAETANASKTSFLANMSHELRTPLNAILGFSEIIARECLGPVGSPRYKEYAGDIHTSGSHLLSLINDLLDVAKIEAGRMEIEPQMIETGRALDGALKFVGPKARERNQVLTVTVDERRRVPFRGRAGAEADRHQSGDQFGEIHPRRRQDRSGCASQRRGRFRVDRHRQRLRCSQREARSHLQALLARRQPLRQREWRYGFGPRSGQGIGRAPWRPRLDGIRSGQGLTRLCRVPDVGGANSAPGVAPKVEIAAQNPKGRDFQRSRPFGIGFKFCVVRRCNTS